MRILTRGGRAAASASADYAADRRGSASVELIVVGPVVIALLLAMVEYSSLSHARARTTDMSVAVGDLVSQSTALNVSQLQGLAGAADALAETGLFPSLAGDTIAMTITSAVACPCSKDSELMCFRSNWSHRYEKGVMTAGYTAGDDLSAVDPDLAFRMRDTVIMIETQYAYVPPINFVFDTAAFTFADTSYFKPRFADQIEFFGDNALTIQETCKA